MNKFITKLFVLCLVLGGWYVAWLSLSDNRPLWLRLLRQLVPPATAPVGPDPNLFASPAPHERHSPPIRFSDSGRRMLNHGDGL